MSMSKKSRFLPVMAIGATFSLLLAGCASGGEEPSSDEIKIGVLAPDTGNLSFAMGEAKKAVDQVSKELGTEFGGKKITIVWQGTDGTTSSAQSAVRKLVENDEVDIVLGPGSGDEGLTVVEYALTQPDVTFVNGAASPVDQTLKGADNFFRFMGDSVMWMGGVGDYAYNVKGYKNVYLLAEDYSFPYDNIGKLSLVGSGMRSHAGVSATFFTALADAGINVEMISTSEIRISIVTRADQLATALRAVHSAFELDSDIEAIVHAGTGR